jgi:ubiquinone/menaquinone biosynthesis C-methylase UbiE
MTATAVQHAFWNKFSSDASINTMMLNKNADQLEESDRNDILQSLPDFTDMIVVDIGAGIGRFTTNFAKKAKHVISADFIESFIEQNKVRNASFDNITYQVNDALGLEVEPKSVDLMFSNWLLMYLNDNEVIEFLLKSIKALKPNAFLKLRESCTESSTTKSAKGSMHAGANPTHYRHASVYIQLLNNLRWRDEQNQLWGFQILFSESVNTYIKSASNWRQVHWLAKKVPMQGTNGIEQPITLAFSISQWMILQNHIEFMLSEKQSWTDKVKIGAYHLNCIILQIFGKALENSDLFSGSDTILTFSPRMISPFLFVDANLLVTKSPANVWSIELNPYSYCERLSKANATKNPYIRYSWTSSLNDSLNEWHSKSTQFQGFVATELLLTTDEKTLANLSVSVKLLTTNSCLERSYPRVERFVYRTSIVYKRF